MYIDGRSINRRRITCFGVNNVMFGGKRRECALVDYGIGGRFFLTFLFLYVMRLAHVVANWLRMFLH